jgi:hypothetical protein
MKGLLTVPEYLHLFESVVNFQEPRFLVLEVEVEVEVVSEQPCVHQHQHQHQYSRHRHAWESHMMATDGESLMKC